MENKYSVNVSHDYTAPSKIIFNAIREGILFKLTGADKIHFDFREGGSFLFIFNDMGQIDGKFEQIILDKKIVLQWNVTGFKRGPEVNTKVLITIHANKKSTLTVKHTHIKNHQAARAKQKAWTEILDDLEKELK